MEWPLFDLRLVCGPVLLRPVMDADLPALSDRLPMDLDLDPRAERFTALDDHRDRRRLFVQGVWRSRGTWSPSSWVFDLAVVIDGEPVGVQTLEGDDFSQLRTVDSFSWLTPAFRGRGFGAAMRTAVLGLAFDHLGAAAAVSSAVIDNHASLGVSRRLGYADNGTSRIVTTHGVATLQHLRLTREAWSAAGHEVEVTGMDGCRPWFGV